MVQSLCAVMLLEGCSPRQAFAKFLVARKAAVQSVFQTTGAGPHRSVKAQMCQITRCILHSLLHISAIFCQRRTLEDGLGTRRDMCYGCVVFCTLRLASYPGLPVFSVRH